MEFSTPLTLPQGFVDTAATATDGRRLRIYYLRKTPVLPVGCRGYRAHDYRRHVYSNDAAIAAAIIRAKLLRAAEIEVLRDFAAAYTRGEHDLNDFLETERTAYYRSDQQNQIGPEEKRQVDLFVKMKTK
ncbi:hypothetical protein E4U57_000782 [Claviceps arundinis]|uniref:Uncharacterized protein n=1 Tax=Claviceps arundinis TaxID=1623583 RepID=A0ABQ7PE12_9HYPO|nr:hypothetical protein E4U57_000782 [Claviceps arundinis]